LYQYCGDVPPVEL
ncbi:hypothetical protein LDH20_11755, partial [Mycobacterium tuberculosis]